MSSKPWGGGIGAWALEAERAEAEEREQSAEAAAAGAPVPAELSVLAAGEPPGSFPSLREAATAGKSKKKKPVAISFSEFTTGTYVGPGGGSRRNPSSSSLVEPRGLTPDELFRLPTGPRERSAEELEHSRLGGGFRSYGYGGAAGSRDGDSGRRPYGAGFDDERRGPPARASDLDQPSRADEADNWAASKKSFAPMDSRRQDRYESLGGSGGGGVSGFSKADEVDNWSREKKPIASRYPSFGSGYRDSPGASNSSDRWVREGPLPHNGEPERPRLVLDPPKAEASAPAAEPARTRPSPFGAARPREQVLTEQGKDWKKMDTEIELKKTSGSTSSHSSRPSSAQSSRPGSPGPQAVAAGAEGGVPKTTRPKVNPFGDAKPREVLLEQQGKDWRKIDMELERRRIDRPETAEEKLLKEEIDHLKKTLSETEGNGDSVELSAEELSSLREQIFHKEKDLELLIRDLEDKVRFGQRATSDIRPGSGGGRVAMFSDRPPSQSGISEESRNTEFLDRPRSRGGTGDVWARSTDEKWGFQNSRDGRSLGTRDLERSKSRERW